MKFFSKVLICVTVIALCGPFFLKGPDGKPLLDARKMGLESLVDIKVFFKKMLQGIDDTSSGITSSNTETEANPHADLLTMKGDELFYRWQDENGVWQFTKSPPPDGVEDYVPVVTNVNANVIDSIDQDKINNTLGISREEALVKADQKSKSNDEDAELKEQLAELGIDSVNPVKAIPKILESTKQIQENAKQKQNILNEL